jgi:hypothetical protein
VTVTAGLLVGLAVAALALITLLLVGEHDPQDYTPRHGKWIQDGATTRLVPPPEAKDAARAGVLRPSAAWLVPEPGEDEWRFPPWPGDR